MHREVLRQHCLAIRRTNSSDNEMAELETEIRVTKARCGFHIDIDIRINDSNDLGKLLSVNSRLLSYMATGSNSNICVSPSRVSF
jgi:hypothetical protein